MARTISQFTLMMLMVAGFMAIFGMYIAEIADGYGVESIDTSKYNKLSELNVQAENVFNASGEVKEQTGVTDRLSSLYTSATGGVSVTRGGVDVMFSMTDEAVDSAKFGRISPVIKTMVYGSILIILGFAIFAYIRGLSPEVV